MAVGEANVDEAPGQGVLRWIEEGRDPGCTLRLRGIGRVRDWRRIIEVETAGEEYYLVGISESDFSAFRVAPSFCRFFMSLTLGFPMAIFYIRYLYFKLFV